MKTYNCEPTLTDTQILEICRDGFKMLKGVVPEDINEQAFEFLDLHSHGTPVEILEENWFVENVILNPQAVGIVRSLLGKNFGLPTRMANHRAECPGPAQHWHRDGGSVHSPEMDSLQVFYYPQDTPLELGPTQVVPGFPPALLFAEPYEPLWRYSSCSSHGSACRFNFHHDIFHLAPPRPVHCARYA